MRLFGLLLLGAVWLTPVAVAQNTYHVDPGGSDANDGSAGTPWATLQHAANQVAPGDVVLVHDGTYDGFQVGTSGTAVNPIMFQAVGSNAVVNTDNPVFGNDVINLEGASYVVIDGFTVHSATRAGIRAVLATGVVIQNNTVGPNGRWGIFTGFTPDIQILNNETFGSAGEHGIYLSNSDGPNDNPIIRGNYSHGNNTNGIQLNGDCFTDNGGVTDGYIDGAILENNIIEGNQNKGFSLISVRNSTVQNNVIYNNGQSGGAGGIHLVDEPGCGNPTINTVVMNNTVHEPNIAGIRMNDGATGNIIFNNLIVSGCTICDEVGGNFIDALSNYQAASVTGLFEDWAAGNYQLAAGSPALNVGVASYQSVAAPGVDFDGGTRPVGGSYDAGAYESGSALPVELVRFDAHPANEGWMLRWETASEANNAGFEIQGWERGSGEWEAMGWVDGVGTTLAPQTYAFSLPDLAPGPHRFRLKQIDFDGTFAYSPEVEVFIVLPEAFMLSTPYPNPFQTEVTFTLMVQRAQHAEVVAFDMRGRAVRTLHQGYVTADQSYQLVLDSATLPSGLYFIRATGETFTATRQVLLAK